jgi:hypothetical protein
MALTPLLTGRFSTHYSIRKWGELGFVSSWRGVGMATHCCRTSFSRCGTAEVVEETESSAD